MKLEEKKDIKKPKTFKEQIEILKSRNIIIYNDDVAIDILKNVNYYRLSAYMLTHKNNHGGYDNISIKDVYNLYHKKMLESLNGEIERSDEIFVTHHKSEYGGVFPIWVIIEVTSFGVLSKMYNNLLDQDKDEIAKEYYNTKGEFISTWLHALSNIRNKCAHYGRLYNKNLTITPKLFKADKRKGIKNNTIFANIYIIGRLSRGKYEWDHFITKLSAIIEQYDVVDLKCLGFPENWETILRNI